MTYRLPRKRAQRVPSPAHFWVVRYGQVNVVSRRTMRPFRRASAASAERPATGASALVSAALLGIIVGSLASLQLGQRTAQTVCAPAACPTCPVTLPAASTALSNEPPGGTWLPKGRESAGNAELQAVLQRVAVNGEVLAAGACLRQCATRKSTSLTDALRNSVQ